MRRERCRASVIKNKTKRKHVVSPLSFFSHDGAEPIKFVGNLVGLTTGPNTAEIASEPGPHNTMEYMYKWSRFRSGIKPPEDQGNEARVKAADIPLYEAFWIYSLWVVKSVNMHIQAQVQYPN